MTTAERTNVGTSSAPVSWLHQRAVALLYDEIIVGLAKGLTSVWRVGADGNRISVEVPIADVRALKEPGGELTDNLLADVTKAKVPGEWDQVGGVVPDLILYGEGDQPVRIIEVIVTNSPNSTKQKKLETLRRRGVDVVLVTIHNESDLLKLCWTPATVRFTASDKNNSDKTVSILVRALRNCSPEVRREFVATLCNINKLDSLFPLRPDNPLKEQLSQGEL